MAANPDFGPGDVALPNLEYGQSYRVFANLAWPKVRDIIESVVAGGLIVQPSSAADFKNPELRPILDRFYRGSNDYESLDKIKVIKLLWDAVGTEFGGRHGLYERNYTGNNEDIRIHNLFTAVGNGAVASFKGFVEQCMSEYDLDGWKENTTWINPDDVSQIGKKVFL
jgi:4-hydroxyphenylacetate 3-monooxygenase